MSNPHLYRRFNLLRLCGVPPPKPVGGFVVGVSTKYITFVTYALCSSRNISGIEISMV